METVPKFDMSEDHYTDFVVGCFNKAEKSREPIVFSNRGTYHAKIVLEQMIARAQISVDIYTGCLSARVYDASLIRAASTKIKGKIRVVLGEQRPYSEPTAVSELHDEVASGAISVRCVRSYNSIGGGARLIDHFAISDHKHIRSEDDANNRSATVILNAYEGSPAKLTAVLQGLFDRMWNDAAPISIGLTRL